MTTRVFRDRNLTNVHVSESLFLPTELGNVTPAGKIAFNTSTNLLSFSDGHNWVDITNSGGTVTLSSVGTGSSLVAGGAGPNLSNKSLVAGTGITLNSTADEVTINSSNSGAITLASTGGDQSLVSNGTGPNLTTKGLTAGTGIELTSTSSAVTIDILTYDAVVSAGGEPGTYPLLSSAISAGKKTIFIKNGTYIETSQIQLNAGTVIVGENSTNVIIYGSGLSSALVTNIIPSGSTQSAGTISINNNSTTVTGSGTSFTNLVAGQSILIASVYYTIASIASNTSLTLTTAYKGTAVSGSNYVATSVAKEIRIYNLSLVNYPSNPSTGAGFSFQQIQALRLSGILAIGFNYNYYFSLCSAVLITHSLSQNSLSDGMYFVDSFNCQVAATGNANGSGNGLTITSNLYQSFEFTLESCFYNNNNNYGISIGGTSMIINCSDSIIVHNKQGGIRCTNGTSRISLGQCNIKHCVWVLVTLVHSILLLLVQLPTAPQMG